VANEVLEALRAMRPPFALYEADIHRMVGECLSGCGFTCQHEAKIAAGCRIDYLIGGIGVEIKKGKPKPAALIAQLRRYAQSEQIECLIVVSWQSVPVPGRIEGKPVYSLSLSQLWGVSLP